MRNKLQYVYSISVFLGVLATSYLMMNTNGSARLPFDFSSSPITANEGTVIDPAVNSLFEIEQALVQQEKSPNKEREPSEKTEQVPR